MDDRGIVTVEEVPYPFPCGDANGSGFVDIDDVIFMADYLFVGGNRPPSIDICDMNCNERLDIDDIVYLIDYLFTAGPAPCTECK